MSVIYAINQRPQWPWIIVGTVNWDSRSFRLNFEVNAIVSDSAFNDRLEEMFVRDFHHSDEVDAGGTT